jgi:hypothetical protein
MAGLKKRRPKRPVKMAVVKNMPYVPPGNTSYKGPISIRNQDTTIVSLLDNATITSAAMTGNIAGAFNNNPSNSRTWTEYSTSWAEYRVLGVKVTYDPIYTVNTTAINGFSGYQSVVHGTPASPASLAQAASTGIAKPWNAFRRFTREWRMNDTAEALWLATTSPSANSNTFVVYAEGGTVSTYYGNLLLEYLVEFRTHNL